MTEYEQDAQQQAEEEGERLELEGCATEHEAEARDRMTEYEELATSIREVLLDDIPGKMDRIMDGIAERCWLKDEGRELPLNPEVPLKFNDLACGAEDDSDNIARSFYLLAEADMLKAGWRPVKEIKKEE